MKRAIVTGASGFVGRHLVLALLTRGVEVWAVVRDERSLDDMRNERLHVTKAGFKDYENLAERVGETGFDAFFHLAWNGTWGEPFKDYALQLDNARYACDALGQAAKMGCGRFILMGTIVQLEALKYMLTDGGHPRYSCIYGVAKNTAAMLCRIRAEQVGIDWNVAVCSSVYGDGDRSGMIENVLIKSFLAGKRPKLAEGNNRYDCTYVGDIAAGLIAIAEWGRVNKTYYVGHRQPKTFRELVCGIRDVLAPEMDLVFGEYPDGAPIDYSLIDVDALYNDTGFECRADFEESIRMTAKWLANMEENPTGGGNVVVTLPLHLLICAVRVREVRQ